MHVTITDTYNYVLKTNYGSGMTAKAITTLNNSAFVGQQLGLVSNYPLYTSLVIRINLTNEYAEESDHLIPIPYHSDLAI